MRKSNQLFTALVLVIATFALTLWGGVKLYSSTTSATNGVDLSECYNFRIDAGQEKAVYYSTSTQANIVAPKFQEGGKNVYYIAASENPTRISIYPKSGNGIASIKSASKNLYGYPDGVYFYTSELTQGDIYDVDIKTMDEVRCGTFTVTIDDPTDIRVQRKTGYGTRTYLADAFSGGKLTVKFDPNTETDWSISHDNFKKIFKTTVNGTAVNRADGAIFVSSNSAKVQSYMPIVLNETTNTVDVVVNYPNNNIPLKIAINPTEGSNDTKQSYLNDKITKVTVDGTAIDRSVWDADNFTVRNGATVALTFESQLRGSFELGTGHLNGKAQTSRSSFLIESYEATPSLQTISVDALVRNPWRYNVKSNGNLDKFGLYFYGLQQEITSNDFNGTAHYSYDKAYIRPIAMSGYKVSSVKINGQSVAASSKDYFEFPTSQDMTIEVTSAPYVRDKKMKISTDPCLYGMDIALDWDGTMETRVELQPGSNEVSYNAADLPIHIYSSNPYVYVDGVKQEPNEDGLYLAGYSSGDVKIFNRQPNMVTITYETIDGTVTHDGVTVASGKSYTVLEGTLIKVVPRSTASNLVLQTGPNTFADKAADKSFSFYAQKNATVSLHPENPKVTVKINGYDDAGQPLYKRFRVVEGDNKFELTSASTVITLPYYADKSTYELTFIDPTGAFEVTDINASSWLGVDYDAGSPTISGVKDGMILTVDAQKPDKPYKVTIHVAPQSSSDNVYKYDEDKCQWVSNGHVNNNPLFLFYHPSGLSSGSEEGPMPDLFLYEGENSYKKRLDGQTQKFAFSEDEIEWGDPCKIVNRTTQNYIVAMDGEYTLFYPENELEILTADNLRSVDVFIFPYEMDNVSRIEFDCDLGDFLWSVNGSEFKLYDPYDDTLNYSDLYISFTGYPLAESSYHARLFNGSEIRIKPVDGEKFKKVIYNGYNISLPSTEMEVKPDANGIYTIKVQTDETDIYYSTTPLVEIKGDGITVNIKASDNEASHNSFLYFNEDNNHMMSIYDIYNSISVSEKDSYRIYCGGYGGVSTYVTRVTDDDKGIDLPFDKKTSTVSGLYDGINMTVYVEYYDRDKTVTINHEGYSKAATAPSLTIAAGSVFEKNTSFYSYMGRTTQEKVEFNDDDLPFTLSTPNLDVYLNDVKVPYNAATGYSFPAEVEDGSVMYVLTPATGNNVTAANMTYEIDPEIAVNVMHDTRMVTTESTQRLAPVGTTVKVQAQEGASTKYQYAIEYSINGGEFQAVPAAGFKVAKTNKEITVRVSKTYNTMTLTAGADTDLSKLTITADGETYTVSADNNTINVPTHVTSMTVTTSENGKYVGSIEGLTFNAETGEATGLKSGSFTVNVVEVERPMEVTVYVDSEDLTDGVLVLGNGKVIETGASVEEGYNTINFSEEDLPIIYRITEFAEDMEGDIDPAQLPTVYVNGEKLEYSPEHGGFVFPVEALTSGEAPVIKIYPPTPAGVEEVAPVKLTYLVEPGITFKATEDRVTEVTEAGMRDVLPGTEISIEASADNGDDIFVEVDGERLNATDGKYTLNLGQTDMTVAVKFEKLEITLKSDDWTNVRISGAGLSYPMYDATSTLQFPQKTSEFRLTSSVDGKCITGVTDGSGNTLPFDAKTGRLTGVTAGMTLNISLGDYTRDLSLMVYLEESVELEGESQPISHLVLAPETQVEKSIALKKGYQTVVLANEDLPLAVTTAAGVNAVVFLNNEQIESIDGIFQFPAEIPAGSIVKIYADRPEGIAKAEVTYDFTKLKDFKVTLTHDNMPTAVDTKKTHQLLPGTEIRFTVKSLADVKVNADEATEAPFTVKVNDVELTPEQDGSYLVKINDDHIANGLNVEVAQSGVTSALEMISTDQTSNGDVYTINGVKIRSNASTDEINALPAGVYIVGGKKVMVGNK